MIAAVQTTGINWEQWLVTALPYIIATLAALARIARRAAQRQAQIRQEQEQFRKEHLLLMSDLKARTEQLEKATPGTVILPESDAVSKVVNGG